MILAVDPRDLRHDRRPGLPQPAALLPAQLTHTGKSFVSPNNHEAAIPPTSRVRITQALERVVRLYEVWEKAEPGKGYDAKAAEWKAKLPSAPVGTEKR